jgi:hypothetical protein
MMHLKPDSNAAADLSNFDEIIFEKRSSIISLTRVMVAISVLLAILMVVSK